MAIVLGIDTGGTYTDGVILNRETKEILASTKALTTHENLIEGISNTIRQLPLDDLASVDYVALSTTLATNAIVEHKGCRVGLLILGYDQEQPLPPCEWVLIPGAMDLAGREIEAVDLEKTRAAVESFRGKVDAIAISGIFSVRNPDHENAVKAAIADILNVPVVMAHELTGTLGVYERTNTAVLNAKLISVIEELIDAVKAVLEERDMQVPLMIVKGDGSLMNETVARERPIETILSGPAASIMGATYLNEINDGLVLDMGGTTSDLALLSNGKPCLSREGADVGGWRTRVSAVNAYTFGLGGDSHIRYNTESGALEIGPRRSWPVSLIAQKYPYYKDELKARKCRSIGLVHFTAVDGLILLHQPGDSLELTDCQRKIIDALAEGPHTMVEIGRRIAIDPNFFYIDRLVEYGILGIVGFTPSDMLCAKGMYDGGDREAAELAAFIIAHHRGMTEDAFFDKCFALIEEKICRYVLTCVLDRSGIKFSTEDPVAHYLFRNALGRLPEEYLDVSFKLKLPLVGIGAPIAAWLPSAAAKLGGEPIISAHHGVANAIGAAAGKVMSIVSLSILNKRGEYLTIFSPWGRRDFMIEEDLGADEPLSYDQVIEMAVASATEEGIVRVKENMTLQGIEDYQVLVERKDSKVSDAYSDNIKIHIETKLDIVAVGLPVWTEEGQNA
ncbi:MAG TPA: hydantoinase/oxoprolinase family protein [Clostridiales bacterium]|nr:hydantoinase/oxoprolinase family protein [Clostridiales bacterium]